MRSSAFALHSKSLKRRCAYVSTNSVGFDSSKARRSRALREVSTVRRALRGAHVGQTAVVTQARTIDALDRKALHELLITPRFIEMNPEVSTKAMQVARGSGARVSILNGTAAFELDLVAGGVGAIPRRTPPTPAGDAHTA